MEIFGMVLRNLFLSSLCLGGGCTPCQNAIRDEDKGIFSLGSLREKIDTVSAVPLAVQGRVCPQGLGLCGPRCPRCPRCPPNRLRHRCLALLPQVVAQEKIK